jgi:hypothetical protein
MLSSHFKEKIAGGDKPNNHGWIDEQSGTRWLGFCLLSDAAGRHAELIYSLCQELPCILGLVKVKLYKL